MMISYAIFLLTFIEPPLTSGVKDGRTIPVVDQVNLSCLCDQEEDTIHLFTFYVDAQH